MYKAIGLITCASVMAASLYLFSGGDPSQTLSAQTDPSGGQDYSAVARQFLQDARSEAARGNVEEARRLAETAAELASDWSSTEESPAEFLAKLNPQAATPQENIFADEWESQQPVLPSAKAPPAAAAGITVGSSESAFAGTGNSSQMLRNREATRLLGEARSAMKQGDLATARARAMQAKQLNASYTLWDDKPEYVLGDLEAAADTLTFRGSEEPVAESSRAASAATLLQQARAAMEAGRLTEAQQLADRADASGQAFGAFEDTPDMVSRDIERLQAAIASDRVEGAAAAATSR
ncbi:MAG: hypothetical protein ACPGXX_09045, partial [Planctomycetaceae bacterium]